MLAYVSLANISPICLPVSPDDITMVICPGIGNHSEKHYIRTFVDYAQKDGYRCAVLNHLGALPNIELTSPRMFTYGETKELTSVLLSWEINLSPQSLFFILGISRNENPVFKMGKKGFDLVWWFCIIILWLSLLLLSNCLVLLRLKKLWPEAILIPVSTAEILVQYYPLVLHFDVICFS